MSLLPGFREQETYARGMVDENPMPCPDNYSVPAFHSPHDVFKGPMAWWLVILPTMHTATLPHCHTAALLSERQPIPRPGDISTGVWNVVRSMRTKIASGETSM
jgi:hypothetical protein